MKKIKIDEEKCIGCGACVAMAEKTFRMNEETSKSEVIEPVGDDEETVRKAIESCPVDAISFEEEN